MVKNIRPNNTCTLIDNSKRLRRNLTEEESILWFHLRKKYLKGHHFRKQVIVGNYIVDFLSYSARLIIKVDGFQHYEDSALIYDAKRTRYLNSQGFTVLRFDNSDVKYRLNDVLEEIYLYLEGEYCPEQFF